MSRAGSIGREAESLFLIGAIRLLIVLAVALAEGFEKDYAGGYTDVEGFYGAGGGQRHQEIAALAGEFVQAVAFAAHDDACRRGLGHFGAVLFDASLLPAP